MTVKEFAKNQGITTQAVYQRIKAAGVDLPSIQKENSPELTAEGLKTLRAIFAKENGETGRKTAELKKKLTEQEIKIEKLTEEAAELRKERDGWREQAERAAEFARTSQEIAAKMQEALLQAQETAQRAQALEMARIQAAAPRRSLWQRLIGGRTRAAEQAKAAEDGGRENEEIHG